MWVLLALLVIVGLWMIGAYNGLISLKNQTVNAFKQIDVQLKRRHDLIPNLVNTVRGVMDFEKDTLTAVMEARAKAVSATGPGRSPDARARTTGTSAPHALTGDTMLIVPVASAR